MIVLITIQQTDSQKMSAVSRRHNKRHLISSIAKQTSDLISSSFHYRISFFSQICGLTSSPAASTVTQQQRRGGLNERNNRYGRVKGLGSLGKMLLQLLLLLLLLFKAHH